MNVVAGHFASKWGDLSVGNKSKTNEAQSRLLPCMCIINASANANERRNNGVSRNSLHDLVQYS